MKILIVDDIPENLFLLEAMLEGAGYGVLSAGNGQEALERLREETVSCIVSDILMPIMDGFQLCRETKTHPEWHTIPFVFYTATYTEKKDEEFAFSLGADAYVVKPQDPEALLGIVAEVLKRSASGIAPSKARNEMTEGVYLAGHNQRLIAKLENKMAELEEVNRSLLASEKKYRLLAKNAQDVIFVLDPDLNYLYVSPSVKILRGYEPNEVIGRSVAATLPPASWERARGILAEEMAKERAGTADFKRSLNIELEMLRKDGTTVWTEVKVSAIRDESNRLSGILGVTRDISERKQAEDRIRASEERLRDIIFTIADWVWEVDENGVYTYSSQKGLELFGIPPEEIIGKTPFDLMPPDEAKRIAPIFSEIWAHKSPIQDLENWNTGRNGSRICLLTNGVPIMDAEGNVRGYRGVDKDITGRKQAEAMLAESHVKLRAALVAVIDTLVVTLEARDPYTAGHQKRVADLARTIGAEMGMEMDLLEGLWMAGSIHDIGKISIPAEILSRPSRLSPAEMALVREHARAGKAILQDVEFPWPIAEIIHQHHERYDGSGYPRGLKGNEIILEARILAVADVVEAIASHRPYRPSLGIASALDEIEQGKNILYDPEVCDACLKLFQEKGYDLTG